MRVVLFHAPSFNGAAARWLRGRDAGGGGGRGVPWRPRARVEARVGGGGARRGGGGGSAASVGAAGVGAEGATNGAFALASAEPGTSVGLDLAAVAGCDLAGVAGGA